MGDLLGDNDHSQLRWAAVGAAEGGNVGDVDEDEGWRTPERNNFQQSTPRRPCTERNETEEAGEDGSDAEVDVWDSCLGPNGQFFSQ